MRTIMITSFCALIVLIITTEGDAQEAMLPMNVYQMKMMSTLLNSLARKSRGSDPVPRSRRHSPSPVASANEGPISDMGGVAKESTDTVNESSPSNVPDVTAPVAKEDEKSETESSKMDDEQKAGDPLPGVPETPVSGVAPGTSSGSGSGASQAEEGEDIQGLVGTLPGAGYAEPTLIMSLLIPMRSEMISDLISGGPPGVDLPGGSSSGGSGNEQKPPSNVANPAGIAG